MRRFHSYGPVDPDRHFCVPRRDLIEQMLAHLVGDPQKGGHYFTVWAPRQAGKTWLMEQMKQAVTERYGDQFSVFSLSFESLHGVAYVAETIDGDLLFPKAFRRSLERSLPGRLVINDWNNFLDLFSQEQGLWGRPLLLLIDEVDAAFPNLLDVIVRQFRTLYLSRPTNWLHGLALVRGLGRAVLGMESRRGSPFNIQRSLYVPNLTSAEVEDLYQIQRSLYVPNLTSAEVEDLYQQYQTESGQVIDPAVVSKVYEVTRGQPGLVSWFGGLLTEKLNPGLSQTIDLATWSGVWDRARFMEPNKNLLNLIAKARDEEFQEFLMQLFAQAEIPFSFNTPLHSYLYMHGVIEPEIVQKVPRNMPLICRFASPFVQECLYHALGEIFVGHKLPIFALDINDDLSDVFSTPDGCLNLPLLLDRYQNYLTRLKAKGLNPRQNQPRRKTDYQLTEAVGHFHL